MKYEKKKEEPIIMSGKKIEVIEPTTLKIGCKYKKYDHWEHEWITFEVLKAVNRSMYTTDGTYSIYDINILKVKSSKKIPYYSLGIDKKHWIGYWFDVVKVN